MVIYPVGKKDNGFKLEHAKRRLIEFMKVLSIAHECVIEKFEDKGVTKTFF